MDEVDNIIIHSLKQIGCKIDEDVISLSSFSPELLVETVSKCLQLIKPSLVLPKSLPSGMAQRFSVTAALAEACSSVGFRGDIGYQTFLYSNVTEVRRVFMFLIERLPKETEKLPLTQPLDKLSALEKSICQNINLQLTSPWTPQYCNKLGIRKFNSRITALHTDSIRFQPQLNLNVPHSLKTIQTEYPEISSYWFKRSPSVFQQTNSHTLCPSVIHKNDIESISEDTQVQNVDIIKSIVIAQNSKATNSVKSIGEAFNNINANLNKLTLQETNLKKENESDKPQLINNANISSMNNHQNQQGNVNLVKPLNVLDEINAEIESLKASIEELLSCRKKMQLEILKFKQDKIEEEKHFMDLKDERKIRERTCILLENPDVNIGKMEAIITATNERMKKLQDQWEEHRKPLVEALEKSKTKSTTKTSQNKIIADQIKSIKEKSLEISEDIKVKTSLYTHLNAEVQKIDKTISRNAYTTRILEIIGNIRKQKNDIDKVLRDTRELQKEINNTTGQLDRQFTVTDDLLYKTAKRDEYSKKAYKLLATLHSDCSELVQLVQETGAVMREIRDLEDQIENEKARNISTNLEKITFDLKQMERESKELQEKIRKVENQITQG